jgi:hypothetical protein
MLSLALPLPQDDDDDEYDEDDEDDDLSARKAPVKGRGRPKSAATLAKEAAKEAKALDKEAKEAAKEAKKSAKKRKLNGGQVDMAPTPSSLWDIEPSQQDTQADMDVSGMENDLPTLQKYMDSKKHVSWACLLSACMQKCVSRWQCGGTSPHAVHACRNESALWALTVMYCIFNPILTIYAPICAPRSCGLDRHRRSA